MIILKCDICGKEENRNALQRTIFDYGFSCRETTGYLTDSWYGEICEDCREKVMSILNERKI